MKFRVEVWDPNYGSPVSDGALSPTAEPAGPVSLDVERPMSDWAPITPLPPPVRPLLFVDGVRRVEARVWIAESDGDQTPALCASYGAGAVLSDGASARVVDTRIEHSIFSASPQITDITTRAGTFVARSTAASDADALILAVQERMTELEFRVAEAVTADHPDALVIIDGPLRRTRRRRDSVGYVKSHEVAYLPPEQRRLAGSLPPGTRTPVFTMNTGWTRHSWYVGLPGNDAPWQGVVRCECAAETKPAEAIALADATAAVLPRFASQPHKDTRAPQNLYPVAALERELRRRLGDQTVLWRALRVASTRPTPAAPGSA